MRVKGCDSGLNSAIDESDNALRGLHKPARTPLQAIENEYRLAWSEIWMRYYDEIQPLVLKREAALEEARRRAEILRRKENAVG